MCLGLPMQAMECGEASALCARGETRLRVSLMLVGPQRTGVWLLVHLDTAVRVLDADEAALIERSLAGVEKALRGEDFEDHFADLIARGPLSPEAPATSAKNAEREPPS